MSDSRIYVLPARHPEQAALPEAEREEAIACRAGARWAEDRTCMVLPSDLDGTVRRDLLHRFGGAAAKKRYDDSMNRMIRGEGEVDGRHLSPGRLADVARQVAIAAKPREVPDGPRFYYYTVGDPSSPYHHKRFDDAAKAVGIDYHVDHEIRPDGSKSPMWGMRFTVGKAHPELEFFRDEDGKAQSAFEVARSRSHHARRLVAGLASAVAGDEVAGMTPLTLPKPPDLGDPRYDEKDAVFQAAAGGIRRIRTEKLEKLVDLTDTTLQQFRHHEDRLVAQGDKLSPEEKREFGRLHRGLRFGRHVLDERSTHRAKEESIAQKNQARSKAVGRDR